MFLRLLLSSLSLAALPALYLAPCSRAASAESSPFAFQHTSLDATGEHPEICLHFNQNLNARDTSTLAHSVHLSPKNAFTPRVENDTFCLGNLAFGQGYTLKIDPNFASADGQHLASPLTLSARFGRRDAHVGLTGDGFILPGRTTGHTPALAIETVNVSAVRLHVFRVAAYQQFPGTDHIDSMLPDLNQTSFDPYTFQNLLDTTMREIWHGTMAIDHAADRSVTTGFPLAEIIGAGQSGLYLVTVEDAATPPEKSPVETALKRGSTNADLLQSQPISAHWVNLSELPRVLWRRFLSDLSG